MIIMNDLSHGISQLVIKKSNVYPAMPHHSTQPPLRDLFPLFGTSQPTAKKSLRLSRTTFDAQQFQHNQNQNRTELSRQLAR